MCRVNKNPVGMILDLFMHEIEGQTYYQDIRMRKIIKTKRKEFMNGIGYHATIGKMKVNNLTHFT